MTLDIISGSSSWIEAVPDEYAIKCVEQYPDFDDMRDRILKFSYVKPLSRFVGSGFAQFFGIVRVPMNTEGIIIMINDTSSMPDVYFRENERLYYGGILKNCEITHTVFEIPNFRLISYYSERNIERQKSDVNAPDWLKEFAKQHRSNVAYFEF